MMDGGNSRVVLVGGGNSGVMSKAIKNYFSC